jgi:hypothetical protein
MTTLSASELDRLEELLAGATDAPWQWLDSGHDPGEYDELQDGHGEMVAGGFRDDINLDGPPPGETTDGRLCAALRNAAPALIAAAREPLDVERLAKAARDAEKYCRLFIEGTFERRHEARARMALDDLRAALAPVKP